jgi:hypothetical protein
VRFRLKFDPDGDERGTSGSFPFQSLWSTAGGMSGME